MPYIDKKSRDRINKDLDIEHLDGLIITEGDLNYVITRLCHLFIKRIGRKYSTLNTVVGVLECAKNELYRKIIAPYEEIKENENGRLE